MGANLQKALETLAAIEQLPVKVALAEGQAMLDAAHSKAQYPVVYAEAFAIAVDLMPEGTILTGDLEFELVNHLVNINWLGEAPNNLGSLRFRVEFRLRSAGP